VHPELAAFLENRTPVARETIVWDDTYRFDVDSYLDTSLPPDRFVTSVRGIVLRGDLVLVQRDLSGQHIEPGGQRETGETFEATLRREIQEETGWSVASARLLGFTHFHHLNPKPLDYRYPHPDFLQVLYLVEAGAFTPHARLDDGFELDTIFLPIAEVRALPLTKHEEVYLEGAFHIGQHPRSSF
jgi:ADP-ribose pyrophosphatase YjhB (NUDIX family)